MEINVHDIIKINSTDDLIFLIEKPLWVDLEIERNPYVIVRRAPIKEDFIPIGVRGRKRYERIPGFILKSAIKEVYTPEIIAKRFNEIEESLIMKETLFEINLIMKKNNLQWGIFGSVGYEIVTGANIINENSDIDIVIKADVAKKNLTKLVYQLNMLPIQVDVLIETSMGGYNLKEYHLKESLKILIKTNQGPRLIPKNLLVNSICQYKLDKSDLFTYFDNISNDV